MKLVVVMVVLSVVCSTRAFPQLENDIASAAVKGDWDEVHRILEAQFMQRHNLKPLTEAEIRELKPEKGGYVHAEAVSTFKQTSSVNGRTSSQSGGHKIINDNGAVTEFNFTPY